MKKIFFLVFFTGALFAFSAANAQTTAGSTSASSKDEFWGNKVNDKAASAESVGKRTAGMDMRYNAYENGKRSRFAKENIAHSKKMKAILKEEKKMQKKHKRDLRMLKRSKRKRGN
ncbi:hypothetical protein [Pontibacter chitinilyticus]|uniref:hypothetical protein n=1 Tax=Pontibacter chitinilyticus TaxID=2674989 RepID=UPI0032196D14